MHLELKEIIPQLSSSEKPFIELFAHGTLSVEIYKPNLIDLQQPHEKDEVYIIVSGSGTFLNGTTIVSFEKGDLLFVKAGVEHCFLDFSEDFITWVIFYGPKGGRQLLNY